MPTMMMRGSSKAPTVGQNLSSNAAARAASPTGHLGQARADAGELPVKAPAAQMNSFASNRIEKDPVHEAKRRHLYW